MMRVIDKIEAVKNVMSIASNLFGGADITME